MKFKINSITKSQLPYFKEFAKEISREIRGIDASIQLKCQKQYDFLAQSYGYTGYSHITAIAKNDDEGQSIPNFFALVSIRELSDMYSNASGLSGDITLKAMGRAGSTILCKYEI